MLPSHLKSLLTITMQVESGAPTLDHHNCISWVGEHDDDDSIDLAAEFENFNPFEDSLDEETLIKKALHHDPFYEFIIKQNGLQSASPIWIETRKVPPEFRSKVSEYIKDIEEYYDIDPMSIQAHYIYESSKSALINLYNYMMEHPQLGNKIYYDILTAASTTIWHWKCKNPTDLEILKIYSDWSEFIQCIVF